MMLCAGFSPHKEMHEEIDCRSARWRCFRYGRAAQEFRIKPVAEKKLKELPAGPLFWRVENFPTLAQAQAAAGPTSLAVDVHGKTWLFTLGAKGASTPGGSKVVEIGPVPQLAAPEYLLRINYTGGPEGVKTPIHTHPGSEAFYVLTGRLGQRTRTARCTPRKARP